MKTPTDEERAQFRKMMADMASARIDMFKSNAPKYADALGTFRASLEKSGFSEEEAMQIVLKVVEFPRGRPFFRGGRFGRWHEKDESREKP